MPQDQVWELISTKASIAKFQCVSTLKHVDSIVHSHSYGIIKCYEVGGHKLIRMKNPWAYFEWDGMWSDSDSRWTLEMKQEMERDGHVFSGDTNDGMFFMDLETFCNNWTHVSGEMIYYAPHICFKLNGTFVVSSETGNWVTDLLKETQYHLDVKCDQTLQFSVIHKSQRFIRDEIKDVCMKIHIIKHEQACKLTTLPGRILEELVRNILIRFFFLKESILLFQNVKHGLKTKKITSTCFVLSRYFHFVHNEAMNR